MTLYLNTADHKNKLLVDISRQHARNASSFYSSLLKLCFILFLFANAVIFYYWYENNEPPCLQEGTCFRNPQSRLPREKWGQTLYFKVLLENFHKVNNEWRLASHQESIGDDSAELNCSALQQFSDLRFIAAGWTKSTYKVKLGDMTLSLKTVNTNGHDVLACMQEDRFLYDCFLIAASKLLREITVLHSMSHPNIVKILGYCIPIEPDSENPHHTVAIFEEYGEPINVIKMLQLSWEDRLRISLGLSRLLKHLASFQEPIALNDFRRQQFVVIDGEPKLIDVDDVGLEEPKCNGTTPCCFAASSTSNKTICVPCVKNVCHGYNEKLNIMRTGGHFIKHILPHGAPSNLNPEALRITAAFELATLNSDDILKEMEQLTMSFKSGWYRDRSSGYLSEYEAFQQKDVSTEFDYRCSFTLSGYGCMVSVHNTEEAAEFCLSDADCKAFVITDVTTWTGRRIIHLKNGSGNLIDNNTTTVYVKL